MSCKNKIEEASKRMCSGGEKKREAGGGLGRRQGRDEK
jgi:hypothetical protein